MRCCATFRFLRPRTIACVRVSQRKRARVDRGTEHETLRKCILYLLHYPSPFKNLWKPGSTGTGCNVYWAAQYLGVRCGQLKLHLWRLDTDTSLCDTTLAMQQPNLRGFFEPSPTAKHVKENAFAGASVRRRVGTACTQWPAGKRSVRTVSSAVGAHYIHTGMKTIVTQVGRRTCCSINSTPRHVQQNNQYQGN